MMLLSGVTGTSDQSLESTSQSGQSTEFYKLLRQVLDKHGKNFAGK